MKSVAQILIFSSGWIVAVWLGWSRLKPHTSPVYFPGEPQKIEEPKFLHSFSKWSAKPELKAAVLGFVLLDETGKTVFASPLSETALCPASALKTLTTGAAFEILGSEFRFETQLILDENGNIVLKGSGDPTFSIGDLRALVSAALAGGLKQVSGEILVDSSVFSNAPVHDHWNWGDLGNAYGAGAFGVNLEHNRMLVTFQPGEKVGDAAELIRSFPASPDVVWDVQVTTGPVGSGDGVMIYSSPLSQHVALRGTVPLGSEFTVKGALVNPPQVVQEMLEQALKEAGVVFRKSTGKTEVKVLAKHVSAPLPEIIDHLHEVSDNLESQCLFLTIGNREHTDPSEIVRKFWEAKGVKFEGLRLLDGSGLARANMIRPVDLARVSHAARQAMTGQRFFESLNASMNGDVRSKLGAMSGVKTEVGFIRLKSGKQLTFALMANGLRTDVNFWKLRGELLDAVRREIY